MGKRFSSHLKKTRWARLLTVMLLIAMISSSSGIQVLAESAEETTETLPVEVTEEVETQAEMTPVTETTPTMDAAEAETVLPASEELPDAEKTPEVEETLEVEETPEAEVTPEAEETPEAEVTPEAEETPETEVTPEAEETPETEEVSEVEETPETEEVPEVEETPEAEEVPEVEETPETEEGPEVEETPETEEVPEVEETPETEEVPEAEEVPEVEETPETEVVLDTFVRQEVFQKELEDGSLRPEVKYEITITNQTHVMAENVTVKAVLADSLSYVNENGETSGISYYSDLMGAIGAGAVKEDEISGGNIASYAGGEVIIWENISLAEAEVRSFVFYAVPDEGIVDTSVLNSVWVINGKELTDTSKVQWYETDLLCVVEEELVEDIELPTEFVYENENMIVTAILSEGTILPEGVVFVVEEMTLSAEELGLIEETLSEEQELQGYAVYDMRFEVDGQEVEPENGTVSVSVEYKETIQLENTETDAEVTEYKVLHLDETSEGTAVEDVTEHVSGTVEGQVDALGFTTDSFSPIVLIGVGHKTLSFVTTDKYNRSYSLENFLTGYNVVAFGDVRLNLHCMGAIICEGDLNLNASGFADGTGLPPSYVKGYLSSSYGRYSSRSGVNEPLYVGSSNTVTEIQNGDKKLAVVNGVTYWENGGDIKVYISDDYFDFGRAKSVIDNASATLMSNSIGSPVKVGDTLKVQAGTKVKIDNLDGISYIDIVGDVERALNTVINITIGGNVYLPQMHINGVEPNGAEQDAVGTSIVWNIPYASSVKIPTMSWIGHVIAQNAAVSMDSGNYNGCIICDSFVTTAEGHMHAYNGGSLTAAQAKIAVTKTLNGKEIVSGSKEDKLFTFTLKQTAAPDGVTKEGDRIVKNDGSNVSFGTFNYVTVGTYKYEIKETAEVSGYTIDGKTIEVIVEIQNAGNNSFTVKSITYKDAGKNEVLTNPAFDNKTTVVEEEKINVKGTKTWEDGNNQDGIRPESIIVNLLADGVKVSSQEVKASEDGSWTYVFENLAKNKDGKEIKYTVTEEAVSGYEAKVEGYDITNTHKTETTTVKGTKTWVDGNNQDGIRPSSIIVNLLADGVKVASQEVKASEDGSWTYVFENLAKNKDGKEIKYTVTEEAVSGYEAKVEGYDITNTHVTGTVRVSGTKIWEDGNNQDGIRPSSIIVNLLADGVKVASKEVKASEDGSWTYVFENLAKNKDGKEIKYTVTEEAVVGYEAKVEGYDITNTHKTETTSVKGTKTWVDGNNQDGIRPSSIIVNLLADGEKVASQEVKASEDGSWTYVFENLAKYKDGKEIKYTVTEEAVAGYETKVEGYDITNTHVTGTARVSGTKIWEDGNNQDGIRPSSIIVNLLADGEKVASQEVKASEDGSWTYVFENLAKYKDGKEIKYTVTEEAVAGYETKVEGYDITNTHKTETTTVKGTKTWEDGNNQDGIRPSSIIVNLLADGEKVASQEVKASEDGSWIYVFENLAKNKDGKEIKYTVTEEVVAGYETKVEGYDIINTHKTETTTVKGTKTWVDENNQDGIRPESIIVNLLADGVKIASQEVKASEDGSWTYIFENLAKNKDGKEIKYTVTEEAVAGYETKVEGYDITNTHKTETTTVKGTKTWVDGDNQDGIRPSSIIVNLLADGVKVASQEVKASEDGSWTYSFGEYDKYKDGKEIVYTVTEEAVEGYETTTDEYNLINTHEVETVEVSAKKNWDDNDNQDGIRPEVVKLQLFANGEAVGEHVELTAEGDWTYIWENLAKNEAGVEIVYTVEEVEIPDGYTCTIEGDFKDGFTVSNCHEAIMVEKTVNKVWNDDNSTDRPASISVQLFGNGKEIGEVIVLSDAEGWTYTWENLPKYEAGKEITYTVKELEVAEGYAPSYTVDGDTLTIVNNLIAEDASVVVMKQLIYAGEEVNAVDQTFYVALYYDEECTQIASDVKAIEFKNSSSSSVTFDNLGNGATYYVGECDADGNVILVGETETGEIFAANFNDGNSFVVEDGMETYIFFENEFFTLPDGFYKMGELSVTKKLLTSDGKPMESDEVFYAGIFADKELTILSSDVEANILELALKGGSETTVTTNVYLPFDGNSLTLYVAEVDEDGVVVESSDVFPYKVTIDEATVTYEKEDLSEIVVITNQEIEEAEEDDQDKEEDKDKEKEEEKTETKDAVATGDDTPIVLYVLILLLAFVGIVSAFIVKSRKNRR